MLPSVCDIFFVCDRMQIIHAIEHSSTLKIAVCLYACFLGHPNIKLFITQGGLQSIEEAIMYHVPMLVMPFFGDQPYSAKRMEYKKVARTIFHQQGLHKETLKGLILDVIKNPM